MSKESWFIQIVGETFGPIPTEVVRTMLKQSRIHFTDFIWCDGFTKWTRISDVDHFASLLPPYPNVPIPAVAHPTAPRQSARHQEPLKKVERPVEPKIQKPKVVEPEIEEPEIQEPEIVIPKSEEPKTAESKVVRSGIRSRKEVIKPTTHSDLKISYFPRVKIAATIEIEDHGKFTVAEISEGGLSVFSKELIEVGTEVVFAVKSKEFEEELLMTGVIIRHLENEDQKGFAIEFMRVNPIYKRVIQDYVSKVS